jgi:Polysaccharide deacetylase
LTRRILIYTALAVVGQALLVAGPAIAKSNTKSCSSVTVGHYKATNVRATPNLGCKAAIADLRQWLKQPNKLPHNAKKWHAKLVRGTWQMAYGRSPVSLYFVLGKATPPKPAPPKANPPTPPPPPTQPTPPKQPTQPIPPTPPTQPTPTKLGQTITFTSTPPAHPVASGFPYTVSATASSGLPVTLTTDATSAGCSLSGATVTFTATGTCIVDANQAGNASYNAAPQVQQTLTVTQAKTVVTLTLDDGYEDMIKNVLPVLKADDLHGTFYVISGALNDQDNDFPNYMSWSQLQQLYQAGNEIGSHTVLHEPLPQVDTDEAIQELCQDRYDLMNPPASSGLAPGSLGPITSMALPNGEGVPSGYPDTTTDPSTWTAASSDGASTTTIESVIKACGFNSARSVEGVDDGTTNLTSVPLTANDQYDATTVDSALDVSDPFDMPTTPSISDGAAPVAGITYTPLSTIEGWVTTAESGTSNNWLSLTLHDVCDTSNEATCDSPDGYQMSTADFTSLANWLVQQEQAGNIVVKTMGQVVGGTDSPAVAPATTSPTNEWTNIPAWTSTGLATVTGTTATPAVNSTFSDALNPLNWYQSPGGAPCYELDQSGTNTVASQTNPQGSNSTGSYIPVVSTTTPAGTAGNAGQIVVSGESNGGAAAIITQQDLGECSPVVASNTAYTVTGNYQSTSTPVFFEVYIRSDSGNWIWWTQSPNFTATTGTTWGTATYTLPPLPAGYNGISYGLAVEGDGTLTVDNYAMSG